VTGAVAGALAWVVTDVSCETSCAGWATLVSVVSFLVVTIGVVLILVLVYRSLAEWNEKKEAPSPKP
jgi:hypothetical protein